MPAALYLVGQPISTTSSSSSNLHNSSNMESELQGLVQRSLLCDWRPENRNDFMKTLSCAEDFLKVLVENSRQRPLSKGDQLPPKVLDRIFSLAIASSGHCARANIRDASRKFRCIVFLSQSLWSDVTTLPTNPPSFMLARTRALWTSTPLRLHLDNSNLFEPQSRFPDPDLLQTALGSIQSLIVEHHLARPSFLCALHHQRFFPYLQQLMLSTGDPESWGALPHIFDDAFGDGVPTIDAPNLRVLRLLTVIAQFPATRHLIKLHLGARTRGSRYRPRLFNKWPIRMVHDLVARNTSLTALHLVEVLRTEAMYEHFSTISLPSLERLVVCSKSPKEPTWVLQTLSIPETTYLGLHVGHEARAPLALKEFYRALGAHLGQRTFECVTAVSTSLKLSGVLLSPSSRSASAPPAFDSTEAYLHTTEIAHVFYRGAPGAVDVFLSFQSIGQTTYPWHSIYAQMAPYINRRQIRCLEINAESAKVLNNSLSKAAAFNLAIEELRLWRFNNVGSIWDCLVRGLTGQDPDIISSPHYINERMLSMFPNVVFIQDCRNGWCTYSEDTYKLIDEIYRIRRFYQ